MLAVAISAAVTAGHSALGTSRRGVRDVAAFVKSRTMRPNAFCVVGGEINGVRILTCFVSAD
jgi:hypothetical protein